MKTLKKVLSLALIMCMLLQALPALAASTTTKPADGATTEVPFTKGTAGSNSFRIPSMVTLSDGTLVAAADARWNTTYDGGGLDTIVSHSSDGGKNWSYTFANYLGDNGNVYDADESTAFIDPAMAVTANNTIYMLVDLYPYGVALNGDGTQASPATYKGFNEDGYLLLSGDNHVSYGYYLKEGKIYRETDDAEVPGYTVDSYFNIKSDDGNTNTNLFFADSPYKVVRTGFLYLTKSTDKGVTWSEPTLLNLKTASEQVCLVAPGRGLVTKDGTIVFPCYSYNGNEGSQQSGFIYSKDNGNSWKRSSAFAGANWSSESAVVELSDGTLRFFYRNGTGKLCYVDYSMTSNQWGTSVATSLNTNSNCQISAITYSKTVDGKQVILVSCPTGPNEAGSNLSGASYRLNGKIFVGLVNDDKTIDWQTDKTMSVGSKHSETNYFMYSCLTELKDGSIGILYEDNENKWGAGDECYYEMSYATYTLDMNFSSDSSGDSSGGDAEGTLPSTKNTKEVEIKVGESEEFLDDTDNYEGAEGNVAADSSIAKVEIKGETTAGGTTIGNAVTALEDGKTYYIKKDGKYLTSSAGWTDDISNAALWKASQNKLYTGTNTYLRVNYKGELTTSIYSSSSWSFSGENLICSYGYKGTYTLGTPYEVVDGAPKKSTKIIITGVKPGTTTAIVGDTTYKITVVKETVSATIMAGSTYVCDDPSVTITKAPASSIATASLNDGKLTITAVGEGTTTVETEYAIYNINVIDAYTITLKEGESLVVSPSDPDGDGTDNYDGLADGQYIEWSSADNSYVGVAGVYDAANNAYTEDGYIIGHNITENAVLVTGTIYNADGSKADTIKWLVNVTEGNADTNSSSRYVYVNVTEILNCTVYYSINGGELTKINGTGVLIDETQKGHFNIMFFAAPDEGYALSYMCVTGSGNQYYTLSDGNPDGTGSGAWPFNSNTQSTIPSSSSDSAWKTGHGFRWSLLEGNMTIDQMKAMFSNAIALGCDGATNFTKNGTDSFYTEVQFVAQKLPTISKEIVSITDGDTGNTTTYTEGMKIGIGDTVNYNINIKENAELTGDIYTDKSYDSKSAITSINKPLYSTGSFGTITYTNEKLVDKLTGGNWSPDLGTSDSEDAALSYTTSLKLTESNFATVVEEGKITNTADLDYTYKSNYSSGTLTASASAVAEITVEIPEYVIDFGLPVELDLSELILAYGNIQSATASYGNVEKSENGVTYTPNTTLKNTDYVNLQFERGSYAIAIYPATTVYYEEGFADGSKGDWATLSKATSLKQTAEEVGNKSNIYGYDGNYVTDNVGASNETEAVSDEASTATFTFTGTGVDIYTNNKESSGVLMAWVKNSAGSTVKVIQVDTHMANGEKSYFTTGQDVDAYNVPVISLTGLERDTYTVELRHIGQKITTENADGTTSSSIVYNPVSLDGFRVYGTLPLDSDAYEADLEDNPTYIELRDKVLAGLDVKTAENDSIYAKDIAEETLAQVYARAQTTEGAVVLNAYSGNNASLTSDDVQDLLDNGPKNELYLRPGDSVVFKVTTNRVTQIGLKALNGSVNYSINTQKDSELTTEVNLNTSTDMFYKLADQKESAEEITYTITNKSGGILSITELKICDDPNATFEELTEEDLIPALKSLGYVSNDSQEYADASLAVVLNDADGKTLASTCLTVNGIVGEINTFLATDIEEAAVSILPEGYEISNASYEDQEVAYGEEKTVSVTVQKSVEEKPETPTVSVIDKIISIVKNIFNKIFKNR